MVLKINKLISEKWMRIFIPLSIHRVHKINLQRVTDVNIYLMIYKKW